MQSVAGPNKQTVQAGYDQIAQKYLDWATSRESPRLKYVEELLRKLPPIRSARVLELGCGAGVPVTQKLVEHGCSVVGNDISDKQIQLAREKCPGANLIAGDMTLLQFEDESFDAVVCFFALFHLPRVEQPSMLHKILGWLKPGGKLLLNLGTEDNEGGNSQFQGTEMFFSGYDTDRNIKMISDAGFRVTEAEVLDGSDNSDPADPDYGRKFLWIVAERE